MYMLSNYKYFIGCGGWVCEMLINYKCVDYMNIERLKITADAATVSLD